MYQSSIPPKSAPVIFVGVDFSPGSDRALRRSLLIRSDMRFNLVLGHVVAQARGADRLQKLAEAETLLDQMQSSVRALEHVRCTTIVRHGRPVDQLALAARECGADLAVLGPPSSHRLAMGPTLAEKTAITARLPVLVAKGVPANLYRRALIATKLDPEDKALLELFGGLFGHHDLSLDLVHLCDTFLPDMMRSAAVDPCRIREVEAAEQWRARLSLLDRLKRTRLGGAYLLTPPSKGSVPNQIIEMAMKRGCDLVAASAGRSSILKRVLLGNTITTLVRESEKDVLVVPK